MPLLRADCDDCVPAYLESSPSTAIWSTLPFSLTFLFVAIIVQQKVYPLLSSPSAVDKLNASAYSPASPRGDVSTRSFAKERRLSRRISSIAFSSTIALAAVLTELLLCEISNSFNPATRKIAIRATVTSLLCLLVVVTPLLEIYSIISGAGWKFTGDSAVKTCAAWGLELAGFFIFLAGFWFIGVLLPDVEGAVLKADINPVTASLERLGITGTLMMALLSGFAAVSAIWQNLATKARLVSEADINRKQAGLDATLEMLASKRTRLSQVELQVSHAPSRGFLQKAIGSIRGNADVQEMRTLDFEMSGLKTMSASLQNSLSILQSRRASQLRASTAMGRVTNLFSYIFACYCVYRIGSTMINTARRTFYSTSSSAATDPVTHFIALFARHVYPSLNQAAWARQISFLLSGFILLASFNAVLQTFHLFARFLPGVLQAARSNIALLVSQIAGLYVISSALMLRNMMPKEVGGVISDALGTGVLQPAWTEKWFDGWFIGSVMVTAVGIWLSQKIKGDGVWDDDVWEADIEMGKRV
jgi:Abscisic acid G-protein coupled receptor/The Golgi pH Regulator (GPHR) Family N-terminal